MFVLVACLINCYIVDYDMTAEDCARRARLGIVSLIDENGRRVSAAGYRLRCELDRD